MFQHCSRSSCRRRDLGRLQVLSIVVGELPLVPFNVRTALRLRAVLGPARAELARVAVNVIGLVAIAHAIDWPLPVWLLLTFVALAFDHHGRRASIAGFAAFCAIYDVAALLDGVAWTWRRSRDAATA